MMGLFRSLPALAARRLTPALLAGVLASAACADTTPVADAVSAQCARLSVDAATLAAALDAIPGLTPLPLADLAADTDQGRALHMALAYNVALEGIVGTDLIAPQDQLARAYQALGQSGPWLHSVPGEGGGVAAYTDAAGMLFVIERAITTGRQGTRRTRCLFIAPAGEMPPTPTLPDPLIVTATPSLSLRGFEVSASQGRIPFSADSPLPDAHAGFSQVTMPVPNDTPIAELAQIGGVTIFQHSTANSRRP